MSFEQSDSFDDSDCAQTGTKKKFAWAPVLWSKDEDARLLESARSQGATNGAKVYQSNLTRSLKQCREPLHFDNPSSSSYDSGYGSLDSSDSCYKVYSNTRKRKFTILYRTFSDYMRSMDEHLGFGDESDNQRYQSQHQDGSQTPLSGLLENYRTHPSSIVCHFLSFVHPSTQSWNNL